MKKKVTLQLSSSRVLLLICLFSVIMAVNGKSLDNQKDFPKKAQVDAIRAKNSLTLQKIEEKMKTYELKSKSN